MVKETNNELFEVLYRPQWINGSRVPEIMGIGLKVVREWAKKGYVLRREQNSSVQYNTASISYMMYCDALGVTPKSIDKEYLKKKVHGLRNEI